MFSCVSCCRVTFDEFIQAAQEGELKTVERYIEANKNNVEAINKVDEEKGRTALIWAAYFGCLPVVDALLKVPGIRMNIKDNYGGYTALWWAQAKGYTDIAALLLAKRSIETEKEEKAPINIVVSASSRTDFGLFDRMSAFSGSIKPPSSPSASPLPLSRPSRSMSDRK